MNKPVKGKLSGGLLLIGAGLLYYIWIRVTGIMLPCPFRILTGIRCPGCGITTMIVAFLRGDFQRAFQANPFLFVTSPYLAALLVHSLRRQAEGRPETEGWKRSAWVYLAALLLFGLWRGAQDFSTIVGSR